MLLNQKYPGFLIVSGWQTRRASLHGHVQPVPAGDRGHAGHSPQTRQQPLLSTASTHLPAMLDNVPEPRLWLCFHFDLESKKVTTQIEAAIMASLHF